MGGVESLFDDVDLGSGGVIVCTVGRDINRDEYISEVINGAEKNGYVVKDYSEEILKHERKFFFRLERRRNQNA